MSKKDELINKILSHIRSKIENWQEVKCTCMSQGCNGTGLIDEKGTFYHMGNDELQGD